MRRIRYFDMSKGVGILCVVLGHSAIETLGVAQSEIAEGLLAFCFSFHMPLFFLIAGYFIHADRPFAWHKEARQLIYTYLLSAVAVVVGAAAIAALQHADVMERVRYWGMAAIYGAGDTNTPAPTLWPVEGRIGALWFLLAMFWARLLIHWIAKLPWSPLWVVLCFALGWVTSRMAWLPWSIQPGMCAVLFVYLGCLARQYDVLQFMWNNPWIWVVLGCMWGAAIWKFTGFSMAMNMYGQMPLLAVLGSIAGTLCVIGVCRLLDRVDCIGRVLSCAGQATLAIICVHLVEDNILPWNQFLSEAYTHTPHVPLVFVEFAAHLTVDALGAWALYHIPRINTWFYPMLAKRRATESVASM